MNKRLNKWWLALCCVTILLLLRLALSGSLASHQHPHTFFSASQLLWSGLDPYGIDLGFGRDYWFYSPFCGLAVYGLDQLFPRAVASWLLAMISASIFLGTTFFWAQSESKFNNPISQWRGWLIAFIFTAFLVSAISWHKLELLIVALELAALLFLRQGGFWQAGILLGSISQWKGVSLSILGLTTLVLVGHRKFRSFLLGVGIALGFCFLSPALIFGWDANIALHLHWLQTLGVSVNERAATMENIYRSIVWLGGGQSGYPILGILAAISLIFLSLSKRGNVTWAFAAGAWFRVVFGPLHQNNSAILSVPLILIETQLTVLTLAALVLGLSYSIEGISALGQIGTFARSISLKSFFLFFWGAMRLPPLPNKRKA